MLRTKLAAVATLTAVAILQSGSVADELPAYILELPPSVGHVLVAETDTATLYRYRNTGSSLVLADQHYMSIGENGVGKQRAWDRRTPLGLYFITDQLDTSRMPPRYGATAFPLDYPNTLDRLADRSGDGIWLHGVDPSGGKRPKRDTDGCLALGNEDLLAIAPDLDPLVTPVVIARSIERAAEETRYRLRDELRQALDSWALLYQRGDLHGYAAMYADDFDYHGLDRGRWLTLQLGRFSAKPYDRLSIDDVVLLKDPVAEDIYLSRFRQIVERDGDSIATVRRLYWRRSAGGDWRIVAEDNG